MKITAGLLLAIFFTGAAQAQSNSWAIIPVTADGILNEWKTPLKYFDEKSHLDYEISNDSANLYVAVSTMDEATQVSIMRTGITLGVNINGKKKMNTTVTYPQIDGSVLYAQHRYNGNRPGGQQPEDVYSGLQKYMGNAGVKGMTGLPDGMVDVTLHKTGIAAGLFLAGDTLNLELVIPLSKLGVTPAYAKEIAYSIAVNHGPENNRGGGGMRGGRMGGVGLGVGMGGGMGGIGGGFGVNLGSFGGRGGNGGGRNNSDAVRIKQVLAKP